MRFQVMRTYKSFPRFVFLLLLGLTLLLLGGEGGVGQIKININTADLNELRRLPGIGPVLAQRIIDDRNINGLFSNSEELTRIFGIGRKKYKLIKDLITVEGEEGTKAIKRKRGKINLNTATQRELEELPGIGPVKARMIIQYRENRHGFSRVEDLCEIYGIGPKTIANLKALVVIRDELIPSRLSSPVSSSSRTGPMTLKCWKCGKTFTVPAREKRGTCPYCGARWELK